MREALAARGHAVSYVILRPSLETCIARAAARAADALHNPEVIAQLWTNFAGTDASGFERNVVEVEDHEPPEMVARAVTSRWQAEALRI